MDFDLSAEQRSLQSAAASLLDRRCGREVVRRRVGDGVVVGTLPASGHGGPAGVDRSGGGGPEGQAPSGYDEALWSAMADQGWPAVELDEAAGGLGLGTVETAVLCEELGRHLAPVPFVPCVLALGALAPLAGADERVAGWVARIAGGGMVAAAALPTPPGAVVVEDTARGTTVTGRIGPVVYGPSADVVVVATPDGPVAVEVGEAGVAGRPRPEPAMDRTRELGWLTLEAAPCLRLGGPAEAERLVDRAAVYQSAELLGISDTVLAMSVEYARDRVQFGKPIGSFQAVKHRLADALVDVEGIRSTTWYAAWCCSVADPGASPAASMAKAWSADASARVLAAALQVHGGIGFTWEHDLHLFLKRAQLDRVDGGDAAWHRDRLAALVRQRVASGQDLF